MSQDPRRARLVTAAVSAVLALLVLAGCGGGSSGATSGHRVPDDRVAFSGTTIDNTAFKSDASGKPRVLWFWAPWCTVCRAEAPDVADVAKQFSGKVGFVGVAGRGKVPQMREFVNQTGTGGFEHVADQDGSLWRQFGVSSQPAFVFVDAQGHATRRVGSLDAGQLRAEVESLLAS